MIVEITSCQNCPCAHLFDDRAFCKLIPDLYGDNPWGSCFIGWDDDYCIPKECPLRESRLTVKINKNKYIKHRYE